MLSYRRDRAAGCVIVFAKSKRLEWEGNTLRTLQVFNHCDIMGLKIMSNSAKRKIRAITAFKVIQSKSVQIESPYTTSY